MVIHSYPEEDEEKNETAVSDREGSMKENPREPKPEALVRRGRAV
jgi:hypothetical protein